MASVTVLGAGLAGCEAAWQLAQRQVSVCLIDMKPAQKTAAHQADTLAELVCSNSLRSDQLQNAVGLLKAEMRRLDSLILACADQTRVPAGGALAVDRDAFSAAVTQKVKQHPRIEFKSRRVDDLDFAGTVIVATGPLTEGRLFESIRRRLQIETLHFFDAAAPIVTAESIDRDIAFSMSRYGKGSADYLNCPFTKAEYEAFQQALLTAETAAVHEFDSRRLFSGCMPIESLAQKGEDTMRFGPLKPVGLIDPRTGQRPYACVQLRQDNHAGSLYNLVGFQTRLKFSEQKRVFSQIPGLAAAEFVRYGVMHRNTFLPSPQVLAADYSVRRDENLFFAGQICGVEGYVESASSGLIAGILAALQAQGLSRAQRTALQPPPQTVIGALAHYVSDPAVSHFQPMNANFGLLPMLSRPQKNKAARIERYQERAQAALETWLTNLQEATAACVGDGDLSADEV